MARVICFDIDGVLTEEDATDHRDLAGSYTYRKPRHRAREICHRAYDSGMYVLLFTGRREAQRRITEDWLHAHGFHYHALAMGKPYFTWIIDDRVLGVTVDQQLDALSEEIDKLERANAGASTQGAEKKLFFDARRSGEAPRVEGGAKPGEGEKGEF